MSDLLAEVDEAMRQERLAKYWHENKTLIITFIVGTIVMTGVFSAYNAWNAGQKKKHTTALIEMIEDDNYPANMVDSDFSARTGIESIAKLGAAGDLMRAGKTEDAKTLYSELASDKSATAELRDMATLMAVRLDINETDAPSQEAGQDLLKILKPVLNKKSALYTQALVDAASIDVHFMNDYAGAIERLEIVLNTPELPPSLYSRAQNLKQVYSAQQTQAPEE